MSRNDPRQPTVDMSPLQQAYAQERQATGVVDQQAAAMDSIAEYERSAARTRAEAERAARTAQAEQERAAKINLAVAKKRGVEVEIDPVTAQERIKRTETGMPVWTPGFTSGPTPAEDGTNAVKYRDPSGQEYQVPLDKINRTEDPTGNFYEFEIPGADGTPQKIRRPEDASKPLFKVDKTTGQRFAEVPDPVTGGLIQQPLGMDPVAANAAAIAKRQEAYAQTSEQRKFQAEELRLQQALEEADLSPIEQRRKELLAAQKKTQTGVRYEETPDGVKAYQNSGDSIGMMIGGFPDQLAKAKSWLAEKKRVEEELAKVETEYQPRAKKVQEMEQARARLALQALQDGHRTRREIQLMEQAAKLGAPLWQTETQKRLEEAMKDPAISRIYTEGQMADEGNPMLEEVGKATRSPVFDAVAQFANRGMSATPDLSGIEAPSAMALTEMLAETASLGKLMPGTPDIQSAAASIGITTPDEYDIEPTNEGGTGAKLMHRASGEWIGTLDADKNRLNLWSHKVTTDQGRAILANATPETAPVFIMGGGGLPMAPNERRDYFAQALEAQATRNKEQLVAIGADVQGIRRNVKEGRLSVQDGKRLMETLYVQKTRDLSTPAVAERLNQYAAASEIESGLWKGPKATPETRAQVIDRFTDAEAQAAQGSVIYDGERLEALRGELKGIFAKKSTAAKVGDWFVDTGKMLAGSITGLAVNLGLDVAEGTAEVATLGNYDSSERGELTVINTSEWFRNAAGFYDRATKGNQAFEQVTAELQSWAAGAEPGDTPPPELASKVAKTMFATYHRFSDDAAKARETSQDSFDPTKDPVIQKYLNRYLEYRNFDDFAALKSMMVMDTKGRAIADRVNQYVSKPRSATPADVIDKAAAAGVKVNANQAQLLLDAVKVPIKDAKHAENIKRRITQVMGFKNPDDALLAMDLFTGDAQYDPSSFVGYFRSGSQAPLQEIALEAASTFTGLKFGQIAARGALGAVKNTTIAATRRAALGARAAAAAASLTDDYSRLGMFAARFGQPLTRMQRASNAVVSIGKGVAGDAVAEGIEEGVMAIGEPGSTPGSVLAQAAQGAAVAPVMVGGMAALSLPFQIRNDRRASRDWNKTKLAYLAKVNEQLAAIPGAQPFTPEEFEQAVTLFGSNAAVQGNQAVSAAFEQYKAAVAASPKLPDGSPVLSPQAVEARQVMAEAIATVQAREALVIDAAVELRELSPDQRTLFTAVAKAQMGINEFTKEEAQALVRQQGANRIRFVPAPTNAAPTRLTGFDQLPAVLELPGRRAALAPGSVPVLPTALLAELSQSAPSLGELLGHPLSPVPAATAGQASPVAAQVAPTQDSGVPGQGPATTATGVVDNPEGGVAAPPAVASPAPISQAPPAKQAAPAATAPPEEVQRVTRIARQVIGQTLSKSPKLKGLITEVAEAPAYATGGMWMNGDGTVAFHMPTIIEQLQGIPNKQIGERVTALLDEEIRHAAQMQAARSLWEQEGNGFDFETWRDAWYGDIWSNQFTEAMRQKVMEAYGETLPQEPWVRAMEGLRMLDQLRSTGSITEAVLRHLAEVLKYLAQTLKDVTPVIQREMDAVRAILVEYGYEKGKGSNPKRAKTQVRKVEKTPPAVRAENVPIEPEITPEAVETEDSAVLAEVDTKPDTETANPEPANEEVPASEPIPEVPQVDIPQPETVEVAVEEPAPEAAPIQPEEVPADQQPEAPAEPVAEAEAAQPTPAPVSDTPKPRKSKAPAMWDMLQAYFQPGAIVPGYGGLDRVISLSPTGGIDGGWSVEVQRVDADGNDMLGERPRRHSTLPKEADLKKAWQAAQATLQSAPAPIPNADIDRMAKDGETQSNERLPDTPNGFAQYEYRPESSLSREEVDAIAQVERRFGVKLLPVNPLRPNLYPGQTPREADVRNSAFLRFGATASSLQTVFGKQITFVKSGSQRALPFEGVNPGESRNVLVVDMDGTQPLMWVIGHELSHAIQAQSPALYNRLKKVVFEMAPDRSAFNAKIARMPYTEAEMDAEFVSDFVGSQFMERSFWSELIQRDKPLFQELGNRALRFIDALLGRVTKLDRDVRPFFSDIAPARAELLSILREYAAKKDFPQKGALEDNVDTSRAGLSSAPTPQPDAERLKTALTKMPELWRNVLEASLNGTPIPDIAQANGISEVAVGRVLEQAKGRLNFLLNVSKDGKLRPTVQVEEGKVKASSGAPRQAMGGNPAFVAVDQRRTRPEEVTHAEMQDMAQRMFAVDPAAAEDLVTRWMDSGTTDINSENAPASIQAIIADARARQATEMLMTAAAKLLVTEKSLAGGDAFEIARLIDLYRTTGTEQARALNMRYDPHQSPKERAAMFISEALLTPPESMRNEIRRNPANKERILKAWSKKAQALKEQLKAQGYDIDATFAALRAEQKAAETTVPQEVKVPLAQADAPTRSLVKGILEGMTWQDAAAAAKMSLDQARTAYNAFRGKINDAGAAAAKAARDAFLASAPAQDFASQIGLPEWADDVDVTQTAVETEATRALKKEREKAKPPGAVDLDNPVDTARLQNEISTAKSAFFDKISEFWRASILSGPQTQVVNLFSGLAFGGYEATVKKIGAGAAADLARMFGMEPDAASLADLPAMLSATVPAVKQAFADAIKAWKAEASFFNSFALGGGRTDSMVKADMYSPALTGPVGKVMRGISFRLMLLADEFVKSFFTRVEVAAQARQIARSEGLKGEAMAQRISELLIPGSEAWVRGLDQALKVTFQTELGTQGGVVDKVMDGAANLIQKAKKGDGGAAVKGLSHFVFPFVATPTNIFKMGLTMSPLGTFLGLIDAARSLNETRKGNTEEAARLYNATRLFDDMVNQIVAWGTVFVIAELVTPGEDEDSLPFVTGSLPWKATSQGEREVAYRTAPPTSIRIGDRWYSYARLDPFASSLVFVVDAVKEFQGDAPIDETWTKVGLQMFTAMQDKTFLQGFSDLMNAIQSPERFGTRFATNIATGFVPNLIRQPIRSADDLIRENDLPNDMGFWDVLSTRIGYSMVPQFAPPAVDVWGREQTKGTATGGPMTDTLLRLFSPVQSRAATGVDPLDVAILRYNMTADKPFGVTAPERELSKTVAGNTMKASLKDEDWLRLARDSGFAARVAIGNRYNGRDLSDDDIETIKDIISRSQTAHRDREKRAAFGGASLNP